MQSDLSLSEIPPKKMSADHMTVLEYPFSSVYWSGLRPVSQIPWSLKKNLFKIVKASFKFHGVNFKLELSGLHEVLGMNAIYL